MAFGGLGQALKGELEFTGWPRLGAGAGPPKLRALWVQEPEGQAVCTVLDGQDCFNDWCEV